MDSPREAALSYAALGWSVFPLKPRSKEPATRNGFKDATVAPEIIAGFWPDGGDKGVAIATGQVSHVAVLDVDPRNGGTESLAELEAAYGALPHTVEALTGGGGRHLLFRITEGMRGRRVAAGLDLKADGGYIVAPPSVHPGGKSYEWELSSSPGVVDLAPMPDWLLHVEAPAPDKRLALSGDSASIPTGQRDDTLASLAGSMRRRGMSAEEIHAALSVVNDRRCSPPLPDTDIRRIAASVARYAPGEMVMVAEAPGKPSLPAAPPGSIERVPVSNVIVSYEEDEEGKPKRTIIFRPIDDICKSIFTVGEGWPRCCAGALFVETVSGAIWWLLKDSEVFAWVHSAADLFWYGREAKCARTKQLRTPPTKGEVFHRLKAAAEQYTMIRDYPTHEPMPDVWYRKCELPEATGKHLEEFVNLLNAESPADRRLLMAATMTPGWAGASGKRPIILLTSDHGQGAGKTTTAEAICDVWGTVARLNYEDDWTDISKRIMSSEERFAPTWLFDNVKGRFGTGALEAAVTARSISGHRMFIGTVSRPNTSTIFVTFNMPELTRDLAERAVVIKIGRPVGGRERLREYVEKYRLNIIADCLARLRGPPRGEIGREQQDRFWEWQDGVLSRCDGPDELAAIVSGRRPMVDADDSERTDLVELLRQQGADEEITAEKLYGLAIERRIWKDDPGAPDRINRTKCMTHLRRVLGGCLIPTGRRDRVKRLDGSIARTWVFRLALPEAREGDGQDEAPL